MEIQQSHISRLIFLRRFTQELLINSHKEQEIKQKIEIEKLRQKFQPLSAQDAFKRVLRAPTRTNQPTEYQPSIIHSEIKIPHPHKILVPAKQIRPPLIKKPMHQIISEKKLAIKQIKPESQSQPSGFNLGKLDPLIKDNSIQLIECPGPGKNIMVKRYNQPNITKITLNQTEITTIINAFSKEARIPIIGGILKAAVGSLVISAVISDFVGSRFIINKITPFSLVSGQ